MDGSHEVLTSGSEISSADLADPAQAAVSGDSADFAPDTDGSHGGSEEVLFIREASARARHHEKRRAPAYR